MFESQWRKFLRDSSVNRVHDRLLGRARGSGAAPAFAILVCVISLLLPAPHLAAEELSRPATIEFDIPAQPADQALITFAEQADMTFMFPFDEARTQMANRLVGRFTVEEAIRTLLNGTSLQPDFSAAGVMTVVSDANSPMPGTTATGKNEMEPTVSEYTNNKSPRLFARLAAALAATFAVSAQAQDTREDFSQPVLEEIVVTASKRGEASAQDLSLAITAFDSNKLERLNAVDFDEFIVQVPGTNFLNDGGPGRGNEVASIRGLSAVADNTVGVVAQYLDGAPHFGNTYRLFDIAEVSVLRGPQGTLWGSQAIGGLISYRSNLPDPTKIEGMVQGDVYSTKDDGGMSYRASGMLNLPVVSDKFALRFAGHHIDETGYITNSRTGTDAINDVKESAWRLSGLLNITDNATVTLIYHGNDLEAKAPTYIDLDLPGRQVNQPSDFGPTFQNYDLINLLVDVDMGWGLVSYAGSVYDNNGNWTDYDDSPGFLNQISREIDEDATTHELRLASMSDGRFNWIVGLYYDDYDDFD
jgi:outer membrane receptor protein involved in Fe transport